MHDSYMKNVRPILDVYDKIQEILRGETISLPKIVVVGDQSSGKSSVLESITGVDLPRGQGTVTRGPIIIQLRNAKESEQQSASIRVEKQGEEERKIALTEIGAAILERQQELTVKQGIMITSIPIVVRVTKVNVPDLTLYDLPGISYQNDEMTATIRSIIKKFTAGEETICLLITPATMDLTNSEALAICRQNEGFENRTIAVITKIDAAQMEGGLYNKIKNNELGLKFDPFIVRNRTQKEIDEKVPWETVRQKEELLCNSDPELSKLPNNTKGTQKLIQTLVEKQKNMLLNLRLSIKESIQALLTQRRKEQIELPPAVSTMLEKVVQFEVCLDKFDKLFKKELVGKSTSDGKYKRNLSNQLNTMLKLQFRELRLDSEYFFSKEFRSELVELVSSMRGFHLPNFVDSGSLSVIASKLIERVRGKIFRSLKRFTKKLEFELGECLAKAFQNYPNAQKLLHGEVKRLCQHQKMKVKRYTRRLLTFEQESTCTATDYYMKLYNLICQKIDYKRSELQKLIQDKTNSLFDRQYYDHSSKQNTSHAQQLNGTKIELLDVYITDRQLYSKEMIDPMTDLDQNLIMLQISSFAYWKTIEKRVFDVYKMTCYSRMILFFDKDLKGRLNKKFTPIINSETANYISEDQFLTNKRNTLIKSVHDLGLAMGELNKLMHIHLK